jgi:hypothetical protein
MLNPNELYPEALRPLSRERVVLPSGETVLVPKSTPRFPKWTSAMGPKPADSYNGKQFLNVDGEPKFAELAIRKIFADEGWNAVWVDSFGGFKYRVNYPDGVVELPDAYRAIPEVITRRAGRGGWWDVFAWKGEGPDEVAFAESKRRGSDKLRPTQLRWLQTALEAGIPLECFLIVEWS